MLGQTPLLSCSNSPLGSGSDLVWNSANSWSPSKEHRHAQGVGLKVGCSAQHRTRSNLQLSRSCGCPTDSPAVCCPGDFSRLGPSSGLVKGHLLRPLSPSTLSSSCSSYPTPFWGVLRPPPSSVPHRQGKIVIPFSDRTSRLFGFSHPAHGEGGLAFRTNHAL